MQLYIVMYALARLSTRAQATTAAAAAVLASGADICSMHAECENTPDIRSVWVHRNSKLKFEIELIKFVISKLNQKCVND